MQDYHLRAIVMSNGDQTYVYVQNLKASLTEAQRQMEINTFGTGSVKAKSQGFKKNSRNNLKRTNSSKDYVP